VRHCRNFVGLALLAALVFAVSGHFLVGLLAKKDYYPGVPVHVWMTISLLSSTLFRPFGISLLALGFEARCGRLVIAESILNALLSVTLTWQFGPVGVLIGTVVGHQVVSYRLLVPLLARTLRMPLWSSINRMLEPWYCWAAIAFAVCALSLALPIPALAKSALIIGTTGLAFLHIELRLRAIRVFGSRGRRA